MSNVTSDIMFTEETDARTHDHRIYMRRAKTIKQPLCKYEVENISTS